MKWLRRGLILAIAAYLGVCAVMFVGQRKLQYHPNPQAVAPAGIGLPNMTAETLATPDGERIVVWWAPPTDATRPTFLYFHGNGGSLSDRRRIFPRLTADGAGLMAVSWRGFGGSTGTPTEAGLMTDARAAYRALAARVDPRSIVFYGESLGTTVAVMLAAEVAPAALVLDSSFMSVREIAADTYPWLPVDLLLLDPFRADLAAPRVTAPVLQMHCREDGVTPLDSARRLNALLAQRRPIAVLEQACHGIELARMEGEMRRFLATVIAAR